MRNLLLTFKTFLLSFLFSAFGRSISFIPVFTAVAISFALFDIAYINCSDARYCFKLPSFNSLYSVLSYLYVAALSLLTALIISISFTGISSMISFNSFNLILVILHVYMESYIHESKDDSTYKQCIIK